MKSRIFAVGLMLLMSLARSPRAGEDERAEVLFQEGRALLREGHAAQACPKFEESQRRDPAVGTLINLAICYEQTGRTASAWKTYTIARIEAMKAGHEARAKAAEERLHGLEPRLSRIRVEATGAKQGLQFRLDGQDIDRATLLEGVLVDPGLHTLSAQDGGVEVWHYKVQVRENERLAVAHMVLPDPADPAVKPPLLPSRDDVGSTQRQIGVIVSSAGLGVAVMAFLVSASAQNKYEEALQACGDDTRCPSTEGMSLRQKAADLDLVSTTLWAGAGALLVGGGLLYFLAPKQKSVGLALVPSSAGMVAGFAARF